MNYLHLLPSLLLAQSSPTITVDKARTLYGSVLEVTITNPTATSITYYIHLEVLVGDYWGPADEDIMHPTREKLVRYTTQSLKPGQQRSIHYNTKALPQDYARDFHTYRLALHYASSRSPAREKEVDSAEFAIDLARAAGQKSLEK